MIGVDKIDDIRRLGRNGAWIGNTYLDGFDRISPAFLNSTGLM